MDGMLHSSTVKNIFCVPDEHDTSVNGMYEDIEGSK